MDKCIRCGGRHLEMGFLVDQGYGSVAQTKWASGEPSASFWRTSVVRSGAKTYPVVTYRCESCGHLESFANPPA